MRKFIFILLFPIIVLADGEFGDIPSNTSIAANQTICRNSGDDGWTSCATSGGVGSGSMTTVKEADAQVGGVDIVTLDFGAGFDLTESPDTEINITLDYTEDPVNLSGSEVTGTLADARVAESNITQHEAALTITESQISDLGSYLTSEADTLATVTARGASTTHTITLSPSGNNNGLVANGSGSGAAINITHAGSGNQITGSSFSVDNSGNITGNNLSGTNTGDQDISGISTNASAITAIDAKTDYISVTQAVDLDTMESDIAGKLSSTDIDTSAEIAAIVTDETGTGALVFANSPVFTTPNIGSATGSVSGNAGTATALAANGTNCSAGSYPLGIDASGNAENCTDATTEIDSAISTATTELVKGQITFPIGNKTDVISTGDAELWIKLPYAGTITAAELYCPLGGTGSIEVDVWIDSYANLPLVSGDSVCASACPSISSNTKSVDSTLTGWTTDFNAGDYANVSVTSVSTFTFCVLSLNTIKD